MLNVSACAAVAPTVLEEVFSDYRTDQPTAESMQKLSRLAPLYCGVSQISQLHHYSCATGDDVAVHTHGAENFDLPNFLTYTTSFAQTPSFLAAAICLWSDALTLGTRLRSGQVFDLPLWTHGGVARVLSPTVPEMLATNVEGGNFFVLQPSEGWRDQAEPLAYNHAQSSPSSDG